MHSPGDCRDPSEVHQGMPPKLRSHIGRIASRACYKKILRSAFGTCAQIARMTQASNRPEARRRRVRCRSPIALTIEVRRHGATSLSTPGLQPVQPAGRVLRAHRGYRNKRGCLHKPQRTQCRAVTKRSGGFCWVLSPISRKRIQRNYVQSARPLPVPRASPARQRRAR